MSGRKFVPKVVRILVFAFSPASALAGPVVFYDEGFETGGFPAGVVVTGDWAITTSAAAAHSGTRGAGVVGPTLVGGDVLTLPMSSVGYENLVGEIWYKVRDGIELNDQAIFRWLVNGQRIGDELIITDQPAGDWQLFTVNLPPEASDNATLALEISANFSGSTDRIGVDNAVLKGQPIPEPTPFLSLLLGIGVTLVRRRFA